MTKITIRITGKKILIILLFLGLWAGSLYATWQLALKREDKQAPAGQNKFALLNPRLQSLTYQNAEERRSKTFITLAPLKAELLAFLGPRSDRVAFYVEGLNAGAWIGWQERDNFIAASILKVPLALGVMKKVDGGVWSLETTFEVKREYKDRYSGELWNVPDGTTLSLDRLMREMLQNSDNTASNTFFNNLTGEERDNVYFHIGLTNPEPVGKQNSGRPVFRELMVKDLASIFRSLYNAAYITRKSSSYILELLTQTKFDELIASEIPDEVKVAHKMANFFTSDPKLPKNFHDCGIVYLFEHPYLYCSMTRNLGKDEGKNLIIGMGDIIYRYFAQGPKGDLIK